MAVLVTVGICVRNGEATLENAVESIIRQTYPAKLIQIIFVDDGSTDRTPQIISQYTKTLGERAKTFKSALNGLGCARNQIVYAADGEYLLFVDSDEILTSSYIRTQVETLNTNPKAAITAGVFKTVKGNLLLNLEVAPYIVNQKSHGKPQSLFLKTDKPVGTGGTTFRTSVIREVGGFDENIKGAGEDIDLVLRIKKTGWLILPNSAEFTELHGGLSKPKDLWKKYFWYGYGCQKNYRQSKGAFSLPRMSPMAGLLTGLLYSFPAYRYLRQKQMFLMPLHYGLKHTAWSFGFIKGQLEN